MKATPRTTFLMSSLSVGIVMSAAAPNRRPNTSPPRPNDKLGALHVIQIRVAELDAAERTPSEAMTRLIIKLADQRNVCPKDLVGAITGEAKISWSEIGTIQIGDEFALLEVPEAVANKVIRAISRTTIKGQRVTERRERGR